jgi:lipopolysaccharide/colanic/teichoic acid biosynthesis glycosyltransferase
VGKILRRYRLDELPQMVNILRGDMSVVGPRPERPEFVGMLGEQIPFYHERHTVRPGLTGWAQIKYQYGSSVEDAKTKLEYELFYIKHLSLFLDLLIVFQTVQVVFAGKGSR